MSSIEEFTNELKKLTFGSIVAARRRVHNAERRT